MDNHQKTVTPKATIQRKGRLIYLVTLNVPACNTMFRETLEHGSWDCFGVHWARWKARRAIRKYLRKEKYLHQPIETVRINNES